MLQSVVKVGSDANGTPHPTLGSVLQSQSTSGPAEGSATIASYTTINGNTATALHIRCKNQIILSKAPRRHFFSVRLAPQLVGLGLLEAVSEKYYRGFG